MADLSLEENTIYWRKLTEKASKYFISKMREMDSLKNFKRDDSFLGNEAPDHIMYKLETLYSEDKNRGYEFLVEYDKLDPNVGIYYGCKGLILNNEIEKEIINFNKEWESIKNEVLYVLNNIFPEKDFTHRFKPTNNANNHTYWPFWISLYEDESIIEVAARATMVIRNIYERYLKGETFKEYDIEVKKRPTVTAFTKNAYDDFKNKTLKTDENHESFKVFIDYLLEGKYIEQDTTYEYCWKVNMKNIEFAFLWAAFCCHIGLIKDGNATVPWQNLTRLFINKDSETFKDNLKKQFSNPTIAENKDSMDCAKNAKWENANAMIAEIFSKK